MEQLGYLGLCPKLIALQINGNPFCILLSSNVEVCETSYIRPSWGLYVTGPAKTGHVGTNYTPSLYGSYHSIIFAFCNLHLNAYYEPKIALLFVPLCIHNGTKSYE